MVVTFREIDKIDFPVYLLPSDNWEVIDGLVYVDGYLLDDRNMPGKSIGIRRLQTPMRDLLEIKKSISTIVGLAKQSGNAPYVDTSGKLFIYEKTLKCRLKYHKITAIERKEVATRITVQGVDTAFRVPRPPHPDVEWAGVLYFHGLPWKLYEFSVDRKPDTHRKI